MRARRGLSSSLIAGLVLLVLLCRCGVAAAAAPPDFLDPDTAFKVAIRPAGDRAIDLDFTIAPGYYLYRDRFTVTAADAALGAMVIPNGHSKFDETFQKTVEIYRDHVHISVPVQKASGRLHLQVGYQGCADKGLCYPPQRQEADVSLIGFGGDGRVTLAASAADAGASPAATASPIDDGDRLGTALRSGHLWTVAGLFFVAGLLLSLTPCVLPMLPILSSIIVGQGTTVTRGRAFTLALAYSLGMALVYTALGVSAGLAGEGLTAALQKPCVLWAFAVALATLALSMFGVYDLQVPSAWSGRLTSASQRLPAGRFAGVLAMGGVSALLVSPCVAAPLAGALVYLSQTHDVWLGGSALFALAVGMSVPLLLIGASAGSLLPRAGVWMDDVKRLFGWLLLGVALWTVQSLLSASAALVGWGVVTSGAGLTLVVGARRSSGRSTLRWSIAALLAGIGLLQLVGAATGASDPFRPWAGWQGDKTALAARAPAFRPVRTVDELETALRSTDRPVMLDFYADWCVSCKEMERYTFVDQAIRQRTENALLLRADVTANNEQDRALLKRFQLFGPPGTIFFDAKGREISDARVIGYQAATRFAQTLDRAGL